jgi:hypothetical protein
MSYTAVNPYLSLDELVGELKLKPEDVQGDAVLTDELRRAIDRASRWVDDYTQRDYFYHDHTVTPLLFDEFNGRFYGNDLYLPHSPVIRLTEVVLAGEALTVDVDYVIGLNEKAGRLFSRRGIWSPTVDARLSIKGEFGYPQPAVQTVTEAGDTANQLSAWALSGMAGRTLYWQLADVGAGLARVRLALEAAMTNIVAQGTLAIAAPGTLTLAAVNNSGVSGTVVLAYTADDTDGANTLTPIASAVDSSAVPTNLPSRISTSARLVAAAFSGKNRTEIAGLDGQKQSVIDTEIPKTVYQLLGKRLPILI